MVNGNLMVSIKNLKNDVIDMMEQCAKLIDMSLVSIINKDVELAKKVIKLDDEVDKLRVYIIDKSIRLIALKQPVARDLRLIYSLGYMALDLERIGDYSVNIAEKSLKLVEEDDIEPLGDIVRMRDMCISMLYEVEKALKGNDAKAAYSSANHDDVLDDLYKRAYKEIVKNMHKDDQNIDKGVRTLFIARYLERIGDHITNICENVIYAVNGDVVEIG